jgi:chromosomal replication initiation ATPase DnaA
MNHVSPSPSSAVRHRSVGNQSSRKLGAMKMAVAAAFDVPPAELLARGRGRASVSLARQTAMYLAHVAFGLSLTKVGHVFGRDRTTAAHACRRMEDRREDPRLDSLLATLEQAFRPVGCHRSGNGVSK